MCSLIHDRDGKYSGPSTRCSSTGSRLCDLLITILESQLYRAHWSTSILQEVERTYVRNFRDRSPENIRK